MSSSSPVVLLFLVALLLCGQPSPSTALRQIRTSIKFPDGLVGREFIITKTCFHGTDTMQTEDFQRFLEEAPLEVQSDSTMLTSYTLKIAKILAANLTTEGKRLYHAASNFTNQSLDPTGFLKSVLSAYCAVDAPKSGPECTIKSFFDAVITVFNLKAYPNATENVMAALEWTSNCQIKLNSLKTQVEAYKDDVPCLKGVNALTNALTVAAKLVAACFSYFTPGKW